MERTIYTLKVTFTTPLLGGLAQKDVTSEYIQQVAREKGLAVEDELETLPEMVEKATTVFHSLNGNRLLYDYHVKGFLKEAAHALNSPSGLHGVKALKSKVDNQVFIQPRRIPLHTEGEVVMNERPLRAMTAQGPRIALARSEQAAEGSWFECEIIVLGKTITEEILRELLEYGEFKGMGQWRNGGWGCFKFELASKG